MSDFGILRGTTATGVDMNGRKKKGTRKAKNPRDINDIAGVLAEEKDAIEPENENEIKALAYIDGMSDDDFMSMFPDENEDDGIEETKWIFDVATAFLRRAVTGRRKKRKKSEVEECCNNEEFEELEIEQKVLPCWEGYVQVGMKKGKNGKMVPNCVPVEEKSAKQRLRDPKGGLTAAGRAHFKRTEGANLKPGVKGAADTPEKMRRKGSFLTRFFTNPSGPMKDDNGKPTRLALSAAAWGEPVPQDAADAAKLAAKGRRMLERYENSKKKD
jgi:hypothetical protein